MGLCTHVVVCVAVHGLTDVVCARQAREELLYNVLDPISHPERFLRVGLDVPAGVLFYGPPGCVSCTCQSLRDVNHLLVCCGLAQVWKDFAG